MSKTKEYIDNMMDLGFDLLAVDRLEYDAEYQQFMFEKQIREGIEQMHNTFENELETNSKS